MRPIRPAAPAAVLSTIAAAALLLGVAAQAEAAPGSAPSAASTGARAGASERSAVDGAPQPAPQTVSDAAYADPAPVLAVPPSRTGEASRDLPQRADLGRGAIEAADTERVLALQLRLAWVGTPDVPTSGELDAATTDAVEHFQAKHELGVTGRPDARTVATLARVSRRGAALDPRCTAVPVAVCVDKAQKVLRFVRDGEVVRTLDANFGPEKGEKGYGTYSRTREGSFRVYRKSADHVSTGYGTPMKWSLFFDGAEAMHFSDYFRRGGYSIRSFGCVDIGSFAGARWVYRNSPIGTPFIVYR